jgi:hypothetical protein
MNNHNLAWCEKLFHTKTRANKQTLIPVGLREMACLLFCDPALYFKYITAAVALLGMFHNHIKAGPLPN